MAERLHSPYNGKGREKRQAAEGGNMPRSGGASWPSKGRIPSNSLGLRRPAKRRHPECETDRTPHRALVFGWLQAKLTSEQAAETVSQDDAVALRALDVYRKMGR